MLNGETMRTGKTHWVLAAALTAFLSMPGCGGKLGSTTDQEPIEARVIPENPVIEVVNGVSTPVEFELELVYESGATTIVDAPLWTSTAGLYGGIDSNGVFEASGAAAGTLQVRGSAGDLQASTDVTIQVARTVRLGEVSDQTIDSFNDDPLEGEGAAELLYPLDGAVVPRTLLPMHIQWQGGELGDAYRVVATAAGATVTAYSAHSGEDFDYAWAIDPVDWTLLMESAMAAQESIVVRVDRQAGDDTLASATHIVRPVDARLDGAIYYWDLSQGKILRIQGGERDNPIPNPPEQPAELDPKGEGGSRCIACHTVSRDGQHMAVQLWGGNGWNTVFDLSADLRSDPAPSVFEPAAYQANFQTFNPTADRLLVNGRIPGETNGYLELRDPETGEILPTKGEPLPTSGAAHPTWSPDGSLIAFAANTDGPWPVDYTVSDLSLIPVTDRDTFGRAQILRPADGKAISWPSFTPDSQWIAYSRGAHSRGRTTNPQTKEVTVQPGDLRMISRDGGDEIFLAKASGDGENSHLPNFSPFEEAGYYWMVFYSTRDYGNAQVGTQGQDRRQMWITAVNMNPAPGEDPSSVPYWLPGQKTENHNMSAYWTLPPPAPIR